MAKEETRRRIINAVENMLKEDNPTNSFEMVLEMKKLQGKFRQYRHEKRNSMDHIKIQRALANTDLIGTTTTYGTVSLEIDESAVCNNSEDISECSEDHTLEKIEVPQEDKVLPVQVIRSRENTIVKFEEILSAEDLRESIMQETSTQEESGRQRSFTRFHDKMWKMISQKIMKFLRRIFQSL